MIINPYRFAAALPFDPDKDVTSANCLCWLEAGGDCEKASGVPCENGDPIQFWRDKTSNNNDFSQSTVANRPLYTVDGGSDYNNGPVTSYDGSANSRFFYGPDFSAGTEGECFLLCDLDADPPAASEDSGIWRFGASAQKDHFPFTDGVIYNGWGSTTRKTTVNPILPLTSPRIINVWSATNDWSQQIDTETPYTTVTNTVGFRTVTELGASADSYFSGRIRVYLMYDGKLSSGDRSSVYNYLDARRA